MALRISAALAAVIYLGVVGCLVAPSSRADTSKGAGGSSSTYKAPARAKSVEGLPLRSVTMQIQRLDWIDKYEHMIDQIADLGADTVKLTVDTRQENGKSSRIFLDLRQTPSVEQLTRIIKHAKSRKLRVILMPIVLLDAPVGTEWRGTIAPENRYAWWESYREMLTHFAYIAEGNGVDVFVVGSELVSMEKDVDQWRKTISTVREVYKGKLTYSSNWDHYEAVKYWDQLDLIGLNSYWSFGTKDEPQPTVEQIKKKWKELQGELIPFAQKYDKPIMFLEIGWFSQSNVAFEPWDYTKEVDEYPIDLDLQKRLFQGFFESWYGNPHLGGYSVWEWSPEGGGPENKGYTPQGKPAEKIIGEWFAKPGWKVQ